MYNTSEENLNANFQGADFNSRQKFNYEGHKAVAKPQN
jgi:hypothetical protein